MSDPARTHPPLSADEWQRNYVGAELLGWSFTTCEVEARQVITALQQQVAALTQQQAALTIIGTCRNGAPHYCPNCDNSFTAIEKEARNYGDTAGTYRAHGVNDTADAWKTRAIAAEAQVAALHQQIHAKIFSWSSDGDYVVRRCANELVDMLSKAPVK